VTTVLLCLADSASLNALLDSASRASYPGEFVAVGGLASADPGEAQPLSESSVATAVLADTPPPNPPPAYTYSNTSTSFTVALEGGGSVTYHAFYANVNSSTKIPQFVIFGGIEKPGCTTTGIAIHQ
jgi:hypothetical protein